VNAIHRSQSIYLTELPQPLALQLAELLGHEIAALARSELVAEPQLATPNAELVLWEEHLRHDIEADPALATTEKESLVLARRGQGLFKQRVQSIETRCRVTGVDKPEHLRARLLKIGGKPWRDATNAERLDGQNGLLLTPSIDHLFDRGFISFKNDGRLLASPVAHAPSLERMGVPTGREFDAGRFTDAQGRFLEYHRDEVFLSARVRSAG